MAKIVTLTMNPTVDKSARIDHVVPERKLRCRDPRLDPGGGGINVARAVTKLGGDAQAFYTAGGPPGEMLDKVLTDEGINHQPIPIDQWTRENLIVLEENSGQQYRFGMPGPGLSEREWRGCLERIKDLKPRPEYIIGSGSLPPGVPDDFYARLIHDTCDEKCRAIVDTSGEALRAALEEGGAYLFKPNLRELQDYAGREELDEEAIVEVARELITDGKCKVMIVSLGRAGSLAITLDRSERIQAPTVKIRSKIGAGDSMVAGIALALSRGKSPIEAAYFGVAAGAAAVMTPGTELCRREDTEQLYEQMIERQNQRAGGRSSV